MTVFNKPVSFSLSVQTCVATFESGCVASDETLTPGANEVMVPVFPLPEIMRSVLPLSFGIGGVCDGSMNSFLCRSWKEEGAEGTEMSPKTGAE